MSARTSFDTAASRLREILPGRGGGGGGGGGGIKLEGGSGGGRGEKGRVSPFKLNTILSTTSEKLLPLSLPLCQSENVCLR